MTTITHELCAWCARPAGAPQLESSDGQRICAGCVRRRRVAPVYVLSDSGSTRRRYRGGYRPSPPPR